jgi:LysR family glycine cleavage system transcriptional activator
MRRNIPSLSALQAFESAARHSSFTRAAVELHLTQGAISRNIRALEDQLGIKLFYRSKRRVTLTKIGAEYWPAIRASLDRIEATTVSILSRRRRDGVLNLAVLPTFAAKWLVPRLPEFASRHPDVLVNLTITTEPVDFAASDLDAAIYFGTPSRTDIAASKLIGDQLVPVCSPTLFPESPLKIDPIRLAQCPLLELAIRDSWRDWWRSGGFSGPIAVPSFHYKYFTAGIQAAISGLGVLLVPHFLVIEDIEAGRLVIPCARAVKGNSSYHLIYRRAKRELPAILKFREWIEQTARQDARRCKLTLAKSS